MKGIFYCLKSKEFELDHKFVTISDKRLISVAILCIMRKKWSENIASNIIIKR